MRVEVLYFEGCPHFEPTLESIEEVVDRLGVDAEIETIRVEDETQARRLGFLGSPSVRVDGDDIEPGADTETKVGLGCRVYPTADGSSGIPPDVLIERALRSHRG